MELTSHRLKEPVARRGVDHCGSVWAVRGHGVVRVGNGNDLRNHWDVGTDNSVRVTMAVDALMMVADDRRDIVVRCDLTQNPFTDR